MNKKKKKGTDSWRNGTKTPHSSLYALILTSCGKIPGFTLHSPNNSPTHKHKDTHAYTQTPRTRKHRQMRHDVCKPLSIKDNRAAINTDTHRQLVSAPLLQPDATLCLQSFYQIDRDKANKTRKYANTHC